MTKRTQRLMSKESLANLKQNQGKSEAELDIIWDQHYEAAEVDLKWEERIAEEFAKYSEAYEVSDLMPNDLAILRSLIQTQLRLDDYEHELNRLSAKSVGPENIVTIDRLSQVCENARKSISSMQDDLKITRKIRKNEREESSISQLKILKEKTKKFYEEVMLYIYCEKCSSLLATIWTKFPESRQSRVTLYCSTKQEDDKVCGKLNTVDLIELYSQKLASNNDAIMPESMR